MPRFQTGNDDGVRFKPGNSHGIATRFKPGQSGNPKGRPRIGMSIREWWNQLSAEDEDGQPRYTVAEIRAIADAKDDDPKISVTKRAAARQLLEMAKGGRQGREIAQLVFDRTEGRPGRRPIADRVGRLGGMSANSLTATAASPIC